MFESRPMHLMAVVLLASYMPLWCLCASAMAQELEPKAGEQGSACHLSESACDTDAEAGAQGGAESQPCGPGSSECCPGCGVSADEQQQRQALMVVSSVVPGEVMELDWTPLRPHVADLLDLSRAHAAMPGVFDQALLARERCAPTLLSLSCQLRT